MVMTASQARNANARERDYKLSDGAGLYLLVKRNGAKYWRMNFRFAGKQKTLALGTYPAVSLQEARTKRKRARRQIDDGVDPAVAKQAAKVSLSGDETFEAVGREWFAQHAPTWARGHSDKIIQRLERDIFPWLGTRPINDVSAPELLAVLRRIQARGAKDTTHRAKQNCGQIFRYAVATGRAERDPSGDLKGALPPLTHEHFAAITDPKSIAELLRSIDDYRGAFVTRCALQLTPLLFVRPGELRKAAWSEVDWEASEWRIPAHKMKKRQQHIVPLSTQAIAILSDLQPMTGRRPFLFPGVQARHKPMSENTINLALRRMGYTNKEMTAHGFRSMASTLLNEHGWNRDAIERQLAHAERDSVRAAYNYAEHLPERRRMMQAWADYLDGLKSGANVVSINARRH